MPHAAAPLQSNPLFVNLHQMDFAQQDKDGNNFQPAQNHDKRQDIFYKRRKSGKTTGRSGCLGQAQAGVGYIARNRAERRNKVYSRHGNNQRKQHNGKQKAECHDEHRRNDIVVDDLSAGFHNRYLAWREGIGCVLFEKGHNDLPAENFN